MMLLNLSLKNIILFSKYEFGNQATLEMVEERTDWFQATLNDISYFGVLKFSQKINSLVEVNQAIYAWLFI